MISGEDGPVETKIFEKFVRNMNIFIVYWSSKSKIGSLGLFEVYFKYLLIN